MSLAPSTFEPYRHFFWQASRRPEFIPRASVWIDAGLAQVRGIEGPGIELFELQPVTQWIDQRQAV